MHQSSKKENHCELKDQMKHASQKMRDFNIDNKGGFRV